MRICRSDLHILIHLRHTGNYNTMLRKGTVHPFYFLAEGMSACKQAGGTGFSGACAAGG